MHYNYLIKSILFIIITLLLKSCAIVQPPTGGPKDEDPPKLISSVPANNSTNYRGDVIVLEFNEEIEARTLKKDLVISPYTKIGFTPRIKRNTVYIKFDQPFEKNTTYTLDFGEAITDITEKNKADSLRLAFSTGKTLDSLYIQGRVGNVLTHEPVKDVLVGLYTKEDTLGILGENPPYYFAKTDENGMFLLSNLKPSDYQVFALLDKDKNLQYNKVEEKVGFVPNSINLTASVDSLFIPISTYDNKPLEFVSTSTKKGYVEISFSKPLKSYSLKIPEEYDTLIYHQKEEKYIKIYPHNISEMSDSLTISYTVKDSIDNQISDNQNIMFDLESKVAKKENEKNEIKKLSPTEKELTPGQIYSHKFGFKYPISNYQKDSITIAVESDTVSMDSIPFYWNNNKTQLTVDSLIAKEETSITLKKGTFIDITGDTIPSGSYKYTLKQPEKYGIVEGIVDLNYDNYWIQMLSNKLEVEQQIKNDTLKVQEGEKVFRFEFVKPGDKLLRVLIDENKDGEWSKGNFYTKTPPEKVIYYSDTIPVKANWEITKESIILKEN